jgi:hypothetical protein
MNRKKRIAGLRLEGLGGLKVAPSRQIAGFAILVAICVPADDLTVRLHNFTIFARLTGGPSSTNKKAHILR